MSPFLHSLLLALLAGSVGLIWGVSELVGAFRNETRRALRTGGAMLILLLNFGAAALSFLLAASLITGANTWTVAIVAGLAWPTVLRNTSFKLSQPLPPGDADETVAVRLEAAYASFQNMARQMINSALTRQRLKLMRSALLLDLDRLERFARMALIASPLEQEAGTDYIDRMLARSQDEEVQKAFLVAFILNTFDRDTLDDFIQEARSGRTA